MQLTLPASTITQVGIAEADGICNFLGKWKIQLSGFRPLATAPRADGMTIIVQTC
jgi:hypothetical protein